MIAPSQIGDEGKTARAASVLTALGFKVKLSRNFYASTYGYSATERERADDLMQMALDPEVKLVFFGGGNGAPELLPYLDFAAIAAHPKRYMSYSDGTTLLQAIHLNTGLITHYGQSPGNYREPMHYDVTQFFANVVHDNAAAFVHGGAWRALRGGRGEGVLTGGYLQSYALMLGSRFFPLDLSRRFVLFLEEHERFSDLSMLSANLSYIENHPLMDCVAGLLVGHYAERTPPEFYDCLRRLGDRRGIPVVACDDFGHGARHGILPIGARAVLDADALTLTYSR
jgi:muramoyltetrapeptide carboxypeptidase